MAGVVGDIELTKWYLVLYISITMQIGESVPPQNVIVDIKNRKSNNMRKIYN